MTALQNKLRAGSAWLVCALVALVALAYWPWLAAPFSAAKMALLFWAAGLGAAALFLSGVSLRLSPPEAWVTAAWMYLLLQVVCGIASPHEYLGAAGLAPLLATAVMAALVSWGGAGRGRALLAAAGVSATVVALVVIAQAVWGIDLFAPFGFRMAGEGILRRSGTLGNPDFVGTFLAVAAPAPLIGIAAGKRRAIRVLSALGLAACAAAIVLSGFRAGVAAFALGLAVTTFALLRGRKRWLLAAAVIAAAAALLVPASLHKRSAGESLAGRVFLWRTALPGSAREWLLGAGPNTFAYTYPSRVAGEVIRDPESGRFAGREQHAENDFVEALYETGLPGLAALAAFFVLWFRSAWRAAHEEETQHAASLQAAAMGGMAALVAAACFDFPLHRPETLVLLAVWAALPFAAEAGEEQRKLSWIARVAIAVVLVAAAGWAGMGRVASSYHLRAGWALENDGAYRTAADQYRKALRWDPANPDANFRLARALAEAREYPSALAASGAATRYLDDPALWVLRYRVRREMGADALPELREAAGRFPYSKELAQQVEEAGR